MGPMPNIDLTWVFILAIVGVVALGVGAVALVVWLASHLTWVA